MIKQFFMYIIIFLVLSFIIGILNWPIWTFFILAIVFFFIILGTFIYTIFFTKNMEKVETFLLNNQKEPLYRFLYVYANGSTDEQIDALNDVITKYKKSYVYEYYLSIREILKENYEKALQYAMEVKKEPHKTYLIAFINAKLQKYNEAETLLPSISKQFMREEILAIISFQKKDYERFELHRQNAVEACKGIQRYHLLHTFEKLAETIVTSN